MLSITFHYEPDIAYTYIHYPPTYILLQRFSCIKVCGSRNRQGWTYTPLTPRDPTCCQDAPNSSFWSPLGGANIFWATRKALSTGDAHTLPNVRATTTLSQPLKTGQCLNILRYAYMFLIYFLCQKPCAIPQPAAPVIPMQASVTNFWAALIASNHCCTQRTQSNGETKISIPAQSRQAMLVC